MTTHTHTRTSVLQYFDKDRDKGGEMPKKSHCYKRPNYKRSNFKRPKNKGNNNTKYPQTKDLIPRKTLSTNYKNDKRSNST